MNISYVGAAAAAAGVLAALLALVWLACRSRAKELAEAKVRLQKLAEGKVAAETGLAAANEAVSRLEAAAADLQRRLSQAEAALVDTAAKGAKLLSEKTAAETTTAERNQFIERLEKSLKEMSDRLDRVGVELDASRRREGELKAEILRLTETLRQEGSKANEKIELLSGVREDMANQFATLAEAIMARHGETFGKSNKEQIDALLSPLKEKITEFEVKVTQTHTESVRERAALTEQLKSLTETSTLMTYETKGLAEALRGSSQTQGAWGEMILDTILEQSGLREGEHYVAQKSFAHEEGGRLRPDVVVNLPGGQKVVVDAKVSLTAFEALVNAASEEERTAQLQRHVASLRNHIVTLSSKDYHLAVGSTLDYVVMFVPIEGALAAALQAEPGLTGFAIEKSVAIATPTTLLIALRTIANVWQVDARNRNAEEIANRAGKIHDKFVGFLGDMQKLGDTIDRSRESFTEAMKKLNGGSGNLVRQFEMMRELGGRATKALPIALIETAEDSSVASVAGEEEASAEAPAFPATSFAAAK
jgi:DNA recombination protein RmuC